jgi:hypothetical protein
MTDSPDLLHNPSKRGTGVRRLNRWPLVIATMLVCVILGAITYTYQMRLNDMRRLAAEESAHPEPANSLAVVKNAPGNGLIPAKTADAAPPPSPPAVTAEVKPALQPIDPNAAAWEDYGNSSVCARPAIRRLSRPSPPIRRWLRAAPGRPHRRQRNRP